MFGMLPFDRNDNNIFDTFDSFTRDFFRKSNTELPAFRTDIRDHGDSYQMEAELPGFEKEDISLSCKDGILTITARHEEKVEQTSTGALQGEVVEGDTAAQPERQAEPTYIRRERRVGSFQRSFDVTGIDEKAITASYRNGVLTVTLPKAKPVEPETHQINIQ